MGKNSHTKSVQDHIRVFKTRYYRIKGNTYMDEPSSTEISFLIDENGRKAIVIERYVLTANIDNHSHIRKFKGKYLIHSSISFKVDTFMLMSAVVMKMLELDSIQIDKNI
jgi:hypothetical protein